MIGHMTSCLFKSAKHLFLIKSLVIDLLTNFYIDIDNIRSVKNKLAKSKNLVKVKEPKIGFLT